MPSSRWLARLGGGAGAQPPEPGLLVQRQHDGRAGRRRLGDGEAERDRGAPQRRVPLRRVGRGVERMAAGGERRGERRERVAAAGVVGAGERGQRL